MKVNWSCSDSAAPWKGNSRRTETGQEWSQHQYGRPRATHDIVMGLAIACGRWIERNLMSVVSCDNHAMRFDQGD